MKQSFGVAAREGQTAARERRGAVCCRRGARPNEVDSLLLPPSKEGRHPPTRAGNKEEATVSRRCGSCLARNSCFIEAYLTLCSPFGECNV